MKNLYFLIFACFCTKFSFGQLVINELDADTPSTDTQEFIELKSDTPNFSLNGFVLVLFNGSTSGGDSSYFTLDLDGFTTDENGIFLIGGPEVSPVPDFLLSENTIQNGADAVAVYIGNSSDFPEGTVATTTNLLDALIHDTDDADDMGLMSLLGLTEQINEDENNNKTTESIQRNNDGTYTVTTPTPGALNDGSGIQFNGILISTANESYDEGDTVDIILTTETNVTTDITFDISITNGTFTTSDYSGSTIVTIPNGTNTATNTIQIIDDADDEGDEVMKITFGMIPSGFKRLNDNKELRIIDNDFVVSSWGTPLNPTYGNVTNTAPTDYYNSIEGLSDAALVQGIQDIIADPTVVRAHTYTDVIDILKMADQSPLNSNQVWLLYTEQQRAKLDFQSSGGSNVGKWNREHTYPRSRGDFNSIEADDIADGINIFTVTRPDSLRHANSDAHGLRATDGPENSSRGNQDYGEYSGPNGNQGSWQGDVARSIFFLTVRYNGLDVVNGNPDNNTVGQLGDLAILLDWHRNDPPDDFEMNRNNIIYTWQLNRNPFIDQPNLVEYIWGTNIGQPWSNTLSVQDNIKPEFTIYPNPAKDYITLITNGKQGRLEIFDTLGNILIAQPFYENTKIDLNLSTGVYITRIYYDQISETKRIVVE
ncbi:endonuclease [Aquimarina litoralis]|uniref:endonuclease n=1 Tax=Aquimarina litoralis TaxID=584605 RepID=UPI001C589546|nr:endonuclease [Aquimarina litoralis]MBW1297540.1 T9SS type A sorting domain-containing protein [Aquimarina litoralis]